MVIFRHYFNIFESYFRHASPVSARARVMCAHTRYIYKVQKNELNLSPTHFLCKPIAYRQ